MTLRAGSSQQGKAQYVPKASNCVLAIVLFLAIYVVIRASVESSHLVFEEANVFNGKCESAGGWIELEKMKATVVAFLLLVIFILLLLLL